MLLNTWVTSYFEDTQYLSTVCNTKGQDHHLHICWDLILHLAIIRDLLRDLAVFPISIKTRLNVLYCSNLSAFWMASWWCAEHSAELAWCNTLAPYARPLRVWDLLLEWVFERASNGGKMWEASLKLALVKRPMVSQGITCSEGPDKADNKLLCTG